MKVENEEKEQTGRSGTARAATQTSQAAIYPSRRYLASIYKYCTVLKFIKPIKCLTFKTVIFKITIIKCFYKFILIMDVTTLD